MAPEQHTIALLHEEAILRKATAGLINALPQYRVEVEAPDPPAFKRAYALRAPPGLVVLTLRMALADDLALPAWLLAQMPQAACLVLGPEPEPPVLLALWQAGVQGFLCTNAPDGELPLALDHLVQGAWHYPPKLRPLLPTLLLPKPPRQLVKGRKLSDRHAQFLTLVARYFEYTYPQIAKLMKVKPCTVEKYRRLIFKRYGITCKTGLVELAREMGLV